MSISNGLSGLNSKIGLDDLERAKFQDRLKDSDPSKGLDFKRILEGQVLEKDGFDDSTITKKPLPATLKFSNHAVDRMSQRGITFTADEMTKIEQAARKASEKGSKETLVIAGDAALIVSLKSNTIVTVMDKDNLKENVFTNIDSTVMI